MFYPAEGFPDLLRSYAKAILKDQPKDVYSYSYEHFMNAIENRSIAEELKAAAVEDGKEGEAKEGEGSA